MPLLIKILGIKVVGTAISLIVFLTKTGPGFTPITLVLHEDSVIFQSSLRKAFTKGLDEIIMSGTEVGIFYTCTFLERDQEGYITPVYEKTTYRHLVYDPALDSFQLVTDKVYHIAGTDLDRAKQEISTITAVIVPAVDIVADHKYMLKIVAALNTIEIEAIEAENFDLNVFWNFKYPSTQTKWISGENIGSL